jgi:taurine dioxygenase
MSDLSLRPLAPALGAVVGGIDLSAALDAHAIDFVTAALLDHQVLFFEGQDLSPERQRAFARHFGPLHIHPIYPNATEAPEILILDTHADNPPDSDNWHTDVTFIETPPLGAILHAKRLPPTGGDTLWASNSAAFDALSPALQEFLDGLTAEHDFVKSFPAWRFARTPEERVRWEKTRDSHPPLAHPVVRRHPVTGRRGLFVNDGFTTRIRDLSPAESEAVLGFLFRHAAKPEFTVRWHWKPGDVAFWDNRITQHYAVADYLPARRIMHRATIIGDRPV